MSKRSILAIFIAFMLVVAASAMWSASTTEREGDPDANAIEDSGSGIIVGTTTVVPEPSGFMLTALSAVLLLAFRRSRAQSRPSSSS